MLPSYYHEKYIPLRQWELERKAEFERQVASASPQRNVARRVMSQLTRGLVRLNTWMAKGGQVQQEP